jgi:hypothetical protein
MTRSPAILAIALASLGCSSQPKIVPVSGIVLIDGQPLKHGQILVAPAGYRPAMATLGPDGRFTLGTNADADGVALGTHPVAVVAYEIVKPGVQKWHAPKKYNSTETSGLTMTVEKATNDIVINLTWEGGKPFLVTSEKE